ncbi:hypothetical protein [Chryseobacterium sp. ISL-6]|uniref:hypothetical protein n=1 Tax=Chryseobacterium sp. ISL-6 TaxID=2819143 RepID=UPI001BECE43C|nr:hypothetical protein [Chryseobacterium sp. ISL-6]MBT2623524.1 hypothetical protein [Chryseobacterium sp. ISL-6]
MKKLEIFWNIIHYFDYRFELKVQTLLRGGSTYSKPTSNPEVQKQRDLEKELFEKVFKNPRYGFSSMMAGNFIFGLAAIIGCGIYIILIGISNYYQIVLNEIIILIVCILPFAAFTYYYIFHKDKYLTYFKEFDNKPKDWKEKWKWISLLTIVAIILFLVLSFMFMDYLSNINH